MYLINEIHITKTRKSEVLIINLINGAADIIDEDIYDNLIRSRFTKINDEIIDSLVSRKYLFATEDEFIEFRTDLDSSIDRTELQTVPNFLIVPTYACNLNCTYCYEQTYQIEHKNNNNPHETIDRQFKFIEDTFNRAKYHNEVLNKSDVLITLMGGEPLLKTNANKVRYIFKKIQQNNYSFNVITNGVDLDYYLDDLANYHVKDIQVTLDGTKEIHDKRRMYRTGKGSFDTIIRNIKKAIEKNIRVNVRVNVDKDNIGSLPQLSDILFKEFGANDLLKPYLYLLQDGGCSGDASVLTEKIGIEEIFDLEYQFPKMEMFYKKFHPSSFIDSIFNDKMFQPSLRHCGASLNQYILDYKGNIYKCWHGIGNNDYSIDSVFESEKINSNLRNLWNERNSNAIEKCTLCKYRYICGTGCPAAGHKGNKHFDMEAPYCIDYKELIDVIVLNRLKHL